VSRGAPRVLLGLFVLVQAVFLVAYNAVDMKDEAHDYLEKSRKKYREKPNHEGGWAWGLIKRSPQAEALVAPWLDAEKGKARDETTIGAIYVWVGKRTTWWARKLKQEQGWSLFAPDVVDWTCFPSLELRWEGPLGSRRDPVILASENEPPDKSRFLRLGRFRLRRYEALFDVRPIEPEEGADLSPEQKDELGDRMASMVRKRDDNILAYMRWRLRRYQDEHPDVPEPTAVILHTRGWFIPKPPKEPDWKWRFPGWRFAGDYPVARWQPRKEPDTSRHLPLEVYVPRHNYFKTLDK
jgi:hypothetical protein